MDHLLSASLIMATHFPLSDLHLLMEQSDCSSNKLPHQQHLHFVQPPPEYTSSPSLNSEPDDDPLFDVDNDYIQSNTTQLPDSAWDNMATPRAWQGEPHKLPTDPRPSSFPTYPLPDPSPHLYSALADYLQDASAPTHSPPSSYIPPSVLAPVDYYPSPTYTALPQQPPQQQEESSPNCDPRFVSPGPASSPPEHVSFADVYNDPLHHSSVKLEPGDPSAPSPESDSGEDEKSDSDDPSYVVSPRSTRSRSSATVYTAPRPTRTPGPEPVPNLTKKSRGRRVPTAAALYGGSSSYVASGKNARTYVCKVRDCGKCFARSEHLKRHVRSIHTNEKPHRCPHPGCNKEFSRHDNLCQHMRVHRNYSAPKDDAYSSSY